MCFGKKKKVDQPVVKQNVVVQPQGTTTTVLTQPVVTQPVIVNPVVNPVVTGPTARSELKKTLQKSTVRVSQVSDPKIVNFFQNARTERVELQKQTNEHASYVRQSNYFDLSTGHQEQLRNLRGGADTTAAMYEVSDSTGNTSPVVNKFYYDRNIVDVGYNPKVEAYRTEYSQRTPVIQPYRPAVNASMAAGDSTMYRGTTGNSYAMKASGYNQPVTVVQQQPATYSTVQPVTYTTVQPAGYTAVQPTGTYSTVQPTGTYSTVQPVHYTSTSDPSYVYTNTTPVYGQSGIQSNNVSSRVQTYPVS